MAARTGIFHLSPKSSWTHHNIYSNIRRGHSRLPKPCSAHSPHSSAGTCSSLRAAASRKNAEKLGLILPITGSRGSSFSAVSDRHALNVTLPFWRGQGGWMDGWVKVCACVSCAGCRLGDLGAERCVCLCCGEICVWISWAAWSGAAAGCGGRRRLPRDGFTELHRPPPGAETLSALWCVSYADKCW